MESKPNKSSPQVDYNTAAKEMFTGAKRIYDKTIEIQLRITNQLFANDIQRMNIKRALGIIASAIASFTLLAINSGLVKTFVPVVIGIILLIIVIIYIFWDLSLEVKDNHNRYQKLFDDYAEESDKWQTCLKAIIEFNEKLTIEHFNRARNLHDTRLRETLTIQDKTKKDLEGKKSKFSPDFKLKIMLVCFTAALVCIVCSFLI